MPPDEWRSAAVEQTSLRRRHERSECLGAYESSAGSCNACWTATARLLGVARSGGAAIPGSATSDSYVLSCSAAAGDDPRAERAGIEPTHTPQHD